MLCTFKNKWVSAHSLTSLTNFLCYILLVLLAQVNNVNGSSKPKDYIFDQFKVHVTSQQTNWVTTKKQQPSAKVRLIVPNKLNATAQTFDALLQINLGNDVKTYWKFPGEGGIAPTINISESINIKSVDWQWPAPSRFDTAGLETLGYKKDVTFPLTFHVKDINKPVTLLTNLTLPLCTDICILTDFELYLEFLPSQLQDQIEFETLKSITMQTIPKKNSDISLDLLIWDKKNSVLELSLKRKYSLFKNPDIFPYSNEEGLCDINFKPSNY